MDGRSGVVRGAVADPAGRQGCSGLASLPHYVQNSIIREAYPGPSEGDRALARLLLRGAVSRRTAAAVPVCDELLGLVGAGHVRRAGGRFWLAEIGEMIAGGALSVHPELGRPEGGAAGRAAGARRAGAGRGGR